MSDSPSVEAPQTEPSVALGPTNIPPSLQDDDSTVEDLEEMLYSTLSNDSDEHNPDETVIAHSRDSSHKPSTGLQVPLLSSIYDGNTPAITDFVRTWETYMVDSAANHLQPLHMFHQLNLCGTNGGLPKLTGPDSLPTSSEYSDAKLLEPIVLHHTHSTPHHPTTSILDDEDEDELPPVGLEILNRSRSTPLSTSANSAFGSIVRPMPYLNGPDDRSAFTLHPTRQKPVPGDRLSPLLTTFNPIRYDKDMETDHTSIEVMDLPPTKVAEEPIDKKKKTSRAAKFLAEVRNLSKLRLGRGGRQNPARPASVSDDSARSGTDSALASVKSTSTSGTDDARQPEKTRVSRGGDKGAVENNRGKEPMPLGATPYDQLEADKDGNIHVQMGEMPETECLTSTSPATQGDDHMTDRIGRVRIQVSNTSIVANETTHYSVASPEPTPTMQEMRSLTPQSQGSPETARSSATTITSGHTTHATSTTYSSAGMSQLSSISETDLEVMEANKVGKLLESQDDRGRRKDLRSLIPLSSSRSAQYPGYIELANSPFSLRDGANVPADRFFTGPESSERRQVSRLRTSSTLKRNTASHSPTTVSSQSMTSNSASSSAHEPPTFVSYLDRKFSDLTSLRESDEASSPREGGSHSEERESSPAEFLGLSDVVFEEAEGPRDDNTPKAKPRPIWPTKGLQLGRKVRSLPPRSPHKGGRAQHTPPPRGGGSPAYSAVSPPRNIVDHRIEQNVSRPYVLRSTPASTRLVSSQKVSPEVLSSTGNVDYAHIPDAGTDQGAYEVVRMGTDYDLSGNYYMTHSRGSSPPTARARTYNEHSIEIVKTDSKDESSPTFVSSKTEASS